MRLRIIFILITIVISVRSMEEDNFLSIMSQITFIEAFMEGKITVYAENVISFWDDYGECNKFLLLETLVKVITSVENTEVSSHKFYLDCTLKKKLSNKELRNKEFVRKVQYIRLKEFLDVHLLSPSEDLNSMVMEIQKQENSSPYLTFIEYHFGTIDVFTAASKVISRANNRFAYIQACKELNPAKIMQSLQFPIHLKFTPLDKYLQKFKK